MTQLHNTPSDPTEPPTNPVEGFVFKPAGSDVWQVWQKINGRYVRIDDAAARPDEEVKH
ncbi:MULTISPECIES: hypothetical protein [Bradyrhizobium]|jgi:hypothetical protein|uniref:hypothetical protein n=1 Tax=Bradyrhizobium TaxID=374 RepID=UPI000231D771|nr:hypothetical protein [Bradyrhizobium japonicum]MCP1765394.1 hypothetical protein [Bradyrhizobium japonicum]MCP1787532.1 hypothetical protein [Bradyrhizobium japonicum]MCP1809408.1 hypothetical protein [Bradyrhizobium japonicum]MCP1818341.1 hypothetical protein [Bradyrhizobium japonicum]MCP1870149.1 hypothetical protein [Bradyrhizobium japonicum]